MYGFVNYKIKNADGEIIKEKTITNSIMTDGKINLLVRFTKSDAATFRNFDIDYMGIGGVVGDISTDLSGLRYQYGSRRPILSKIGYNVKTHPILLTPVEGKAIEYVATFSGNVFDGVPIRELGLFSVDYNANINNPSLGGGMQCRATASEGEIVLGLTDTLEVKWSIVLI